MVPTSTSVTIYRSLSINTLIVAGSRSAARSSSVGFNFAESTIYFFKSATSGCWGADNSVASGVITIGKPGIGSNSTPACDDSTVADPDVGSFIIEGQLSELQQLASAAQKNLAPSPIMKSSISKMNDIGANAPTSLRNSCNSWHMR